MNTDASKQNNPELNMQVDKSRQINTDMYHTHINKKRTHPYDPKYKISHLNPHRNTKQYEHEYKIVHIYTHMNTR